jgi:hypothetical protein
MVEKFKEALKQIEEAKGKVTLFAIIKTDDLADKWSVVLCAPWATLEKRSDIFNFVKNLLAPVLTKEESESIARIGIFQKEEHLIQSLLAFQSDFTIKEDTKINGFTIHEGYIFASNPNI